MRMIRSILPIAAGMALAAPQANAAAPPRIVIAGDDTAAAYGPAAYPEFGWGMLLKCGLRPDTMVLDAARPGLSTKGYIATGLLDRLGQDLDQGDVLLIHFGFEDERTYLATTYTNPATDFRANLRKFVDLARTKGATPVLVTPVSRRSYSDGRWIDTHGPYARAVREVGAATRTPVIDLTASSLAWLRQIGPAASEPYFLRRPGAPANGPGGASGVDPSHLSELGARKVADLLLADLALLDLPLSKAVLAERPSLTRIAPVESSACE